jgi:hypothetical protein
VFEMQEQLKEMKIDENNILNFLYEIKKYLHLSHFMHILYYMHTCTKKNNIYDIRWENRKNSEIGNQHLLMVTSMMVIDQSVSGL